MILTDIAIRNRTTVGVLTFLIIVGGIFSYATLPREAAPDVPIPILLISTPYEGVSPEDIESSVTMKIEKKLAGLKGVKEIRSSSIEGLSFIVIEFLPDVRVEDALQYVRDKVDQAKADLPIEAEEPAIAEINVGELPIIYVNISGTISPVRLKAMADELQDYIEVVPGVLTCEILGALEREIRLEIDPDRVAAYGLTIPELMRLIPSENVNVSAGGLETKGTKFNIRVPAEFVEPEEVDHLLLTVRNGKPIYLSDVATVSDTFKDRLTYSRLDGAASITLSIQKRVGANILDISQAVDRILDQARKIAPQGVTIETTMDRSADTKRMVADLENNVITGAILVLVVLAVFMGLRVSTIVAVALPLSMLMGLAIIQAMGYTLNMIVLFSLILAVGRLVDDAIVIVENIYRHMQLGYGPIEAARKGAAEVAWPVITSTLTTVAAFIPLLFWPGIIGNFMKYLPATVIITLSCSLFVALVINPTICAMIPQGKVPQRKATHWFFERYRAFLRGAMTHRFTTLMLAVLVLVASILLYVLRAPGVEFFPQTDPQRAIVDLRLPQGTSIQESDRLARLVEGRIERHRPYMKHVVTNVGMAGQSSLLSMGTGGPHLANVTILFPEYEVRTHPSEDIIAEIRRELSDIAGAEVTVDKEKTGPPTGEAVTVRIIGPDFKTLQDLCQRAKKLMADVPGMVNMRSDLEATRPELAFKVDRSRAMLLGVNTAVVGNFLKTAVFGNKVGTYRQFNDEYDITVRLPVTQRTNIEDILRLRVPNDAGSAIPLSSLGEFSYKGGFGTINRVNQRRVVTVTAGAEGRLGSDVLRDVQTRLAGLELPTGGYEIRYAGEKEEQDKAAVFLGRAFVIGCLMIVLILVAQFNTLLVPAIIMTTVALSLVGVLAGLIAFNMPFSVIMTGIAIICLAGVVVTNAIVLLDYTRLLQARGMDLIAASVEAGATRLRPVLLTAGTTIMGLIPMAFGVSFDFHTFTLATRSESSELWRNMAVAVIFGLTSATVLTLVVVPTLYVSLYRIIARWGFGGLKQPVSEDAAAPGQTPSA